MLFWVSINYCGSQSEASLSFGPIESHIGNLEQEYTKESTLFSFVQMSMSRFCQLGESCSLLILETELLLLDCQWLSCSQGSKQRKSLPGWCKVMFPLHFGCWQARKEHWRKRRVLPCQGHWCRSQNESRAGHQDGPSSSPHVSCCLPLLFARPLDKTLLLMPVLHFLGCSAFFKVSIYFQYLYCFYSYFHRFFLTMPFASSFHSISPLDFPKSKEENCK